jgi:hypothetical protein
LDNIYKILPHESRDLHSQIAKELVRLASLSKRHNLVSEGDLLLDVLADPADPATIRLDRWQDIIKGGGAECAWLVLIGSRESDRGVIANAIADYEAANDAWTRRLGQAEKLLLADFIIEKSAMLKRAASESSAMYLDLSSDKFHHDLEACIYHIDLHARQVAI